ncbi:MAG: ATP-binding protein [Clostridia bacterium]|nr:ATP-binding protein [Clostridia bacterium]
MSSFFKAVLVTGARQVGKTTMLKHLAKDTERTYVSMDNIMVRTLAKSDPVLFFQTYKPPIIIDEIQKAPELFEQIKIICDESEETGLFWLTGSQQYNMMKNVRETLAGRVGILELYSLTANEIEGRAFQNELDFSFQCLRERMPFAPKNNILDVFEHIWCGGMPAALTADGELHREYFNSYIETYLMRDVSEDGGVTDTVKFSRFLIACAALCAEQVNYKTLADAADISQPLAKDWLRLLQSLGIIYLLQPFANNALKRLVKTPKLYFCDTALAAHLSGWLTRDTLMNGAASGHYFENHVVIELVKNFAYSPSKVNLSYYRDSNAKEIDLFIEENGLIHPLEIKKSANPDRREVKKYEILDKTNLSRGSGGIICMCEEPIPIDDKNSFIPCNLI